MKINWGWSIVIALAIFMSFILYLVFSCIGEKVELVAKDYYDRELRYQDRINKEDNYSRLSSKFRFEQVDSVLIVHYPEKLPHADASGEIVFFRPDDSGSDFIVPVKPEIDNSQLISMAGIRKGLWLLKISLSMDGVDYYSEQKLMIR